MEDRPVRTLPPAGAIQDEREIEAVMNVLRSGNLFIGENVARFEDEVSTLLGKNRGVMVNSGSSALLLAIGLLDLEPGDEIITSVLTFSTDVAPMVQQQLVPVFVDVEPDTFQIDVNRIPEMIGPRTRAILAPNLMGNCPRLGCHPGHRRRARAQGDRGFLRCAGHPAAGHPDRHPQRHQRHQLRHLPLAHLRGQRRHGGHGRPRNARQVPHPAALGTALGVVPVRLPAGAGNPLGSAGGWHHVRPDLHLRRHRLQPRAVGAGGGLRAGATNQAPGVQRPPPPCLRPLQTTCWSTTPTR